MKEFQNYGNKSYYKTDALMYSLYSIGYELIVTNFVTYKFYIYVYKQIKTKAIVIFIPWYFLQII